MRRRTYRSVISTLTALGFGALALGCGGCGGDTASSEDVDAGTTSDGSIDAAIWNGPCWPMDTASPGGSVEIGSGDSFVPLSDELTIVYGAQDGYMFLLNVRQSGITPGDPHNILNVTNPRTRAHAFFDDTNIPLGGVGGCPTRLPYTDMGNGTYEFTSAMPLIFDSCWRSDNIVGKRVRIELELLDWNGMTYAHDTRVVTAIDLGADTHPPEQNSPGCPL